jgi:DICT domain-containing protein
MIEAGTDKTADDGTLDGTLVDSIMANPAVVNKMTWVDDNCETKVVATTTGDDQTDGMVTDDGNVMKVTALDGTDWITVDGTDDGTLVEATITADGDEPIGINWLDGSDETNEIGTTTGDENPVDGMVTDDGMKTNDEVATVETIEAGTLKIYDEATDDGTLVYSTIANPAVVKRMTWVEANEATADVATTTGDDQTDGMVTDDGKVTKVTALDGIDWMTDDGTDDGTLVEATMTADGDEPIATIWVDGSDETHEIGTTTGDENPVDGMATDDGMKTNDEVGTDETIEDGTLNTYDEATDDGTLVDSMIAKPAVVNKMTWVDGNEETTEVATKTGDDQTDGMVTDDGKVINVTALDGTDWITLDGTYDGTLVEATITADGDDPISTIWLDGSDETNEIGTTTGDENPVDGMATDDGI